MIEVPVIEVMLWGRRAGVMSWDDNRGFADWQFDSSFRASGLEISPLVIRS